MRAKEFIVEAKPENLGEKVCHQLCKAWDGKKDSDASMDQIQDALFNTDNWAIEYDTSIPEKARDYDICLAAMATSGKSLVYVPGTMRDYKMCLAAVEQNVEAMDFVPDAARAKLIKLK